MNKSEQINELASALAKAQGEMENASKDSKNLFYNSKYADLAEVWNTARTPLSKHGLSVIQTPVFEDYGIFLETVLMHSSGQWIIGRFPLKFAKDDMQGYGTSVTYARRFGLQAIIGIAAEDDDGNLASGKLVPPPHQPAPKPPAPAPIPAPSASPLAAVSKPNAFAKARDQAQAATRSQELEKLIETSGKWTKKQVSDYMMMFVGKNKPGDYTDSEWASLREVVLSKDPEVMTNNPRALIPKPKQIEDLGLDFANSPN